MKKTLYTILLLVVVIALGAAYYSWKMAPEPSRVDVHRSLIAEIAPMVRLCSVDIYEEVPVRGAIADRHLFARAVFRGSVSFDIEKLQAEERGDTLFVTLPPEIVEVYESTDPGSYEVIDTWSDRLLGSANFTTAEENAIKENARMELRDRIYHKGYVRRARKEAAENIRKMLGGMTGKTVVVEGG